MSRNLIPTPIVNKNGVATTVHRKPAATGASSKPLPAPQTSSTLPLMGKSDTVDKRWRCKPSEWGQGSDQRLVNECHGLSPATTIHVSNAQAWDVMSVSPENALPLISVGIRSRAEAEQFLTEHGLSELIGDHSELVSDVIERKVKPFHLAKFLSQHEGSVNHKDIAKIAEMTSDNRYVRMSEEQSYISDRPNITQMLLDDELDADDITQIGLGTFTERMRYQQEWGVLKHISMLKQGQMPHSSIELVKEALEAKQPHRELILLGVFGKDGLDQIDDKYKDIAASFEDALFDSKHSLEERQEIFEYAKQIALTKGSVYIKPFKPHEIVRLYESDIDHERALEFSSERLTIEQIIGIIDGNVSGNLSKGWL